MMDKAEKERMFDLMMDRCCTGMSGEDKSKVKEQMLSCCRHMEAMLSRFKDRSKGKPEGFRSCCGRMDFSRFMKDCCKGESDGKPEA